MTLEEMITNVERFGGGDIIEDRKMLIASANRALHELYLSIPVLKTVRFYAKGHKPTTYHKEIVCKTGQTIILPLVGYAYSMRVMGKGNCTVIDGEKVSAKQFDTGNDALTISGFISKGGTIKFWGSFTFVIYDFSLFDEIYDIQVTSIPVGTDTAIYDIRKMYGDFLAFTSPATDRFGKVLENCRLHDGMLEVDSGFRGEIILTYRRLPTAIYGVDELNDANEIIDVSDEYSHLLIYLIWYHYWYVTDEAKAKIYKSKFDDMLALLNDNYRIIDKSYVDVNGWA